MTRNLTTLSSRQITAHVFCAACEQRFNREGETWSVSRLATRRGFPLRDLIQRSQPICEDAVITFYSCNRIPPLRVESLTHFAMGVFWKASVYPWKVFGESINKLAFGSYAERIRQYLAGIGGFPTNMSLMVHVDPLPNPFIAFHLPRARKSGQLHWFDWYVNGVEFVLVVGRAIPTDMKDACIFSAPNHLIFLVRDLQGHLNSVLKRSAPPKKVSGNVLVAYEHYKKLRTNDPGASS